MYCKREENLKNCNCTYGDCEKKGVCCECVKYHREKGQLPACYFDKESEKTFDRSVRKFLAMRK